MVVGDVVNAAVANVTVFAFRPAAGVSVVVTSLMSEASTPPEYMSLTDGVNIGFVDIGTVGNFGRMTNTKFMIDNNVWITFKTAGLGGSFSGLQIQ